VRSDVWRQYSRIINSYQTLKTAHMIIALRKSPLIQRTRAQVKEQGAWSMELHDPTLARVLTDAQLFFF
jgi:hypothetical protein